VATAQTSPLALAQNLLSLLTPQCQATVVTALNSSSPIYECLHVDALLPILLTNGSILPPLDAYLSTVCSSAPCSSSVLNATAQSLLEGCSTDLGLAGISNSTVYEVFELYPLAREIACLKTTNPMTYANASIPLNSTSYNMTNGTFCVTDILSDVSGYLGVNLTNSFIDSALLGANASAVRMLEMVPPQAFCQECVVAGLELIELEYPELGNVTSGYFGGNATLNQVFDSTCAAVGLSISSNGTLPMNITVVGVNSTFPFNVTVGNMTIPGNASTTIPMLNTTAISAIMSASATASGAMAEKKRWFGQW